MPFLHGSVNLGCEVVDTLEEGGGLLGKQKTSFAGDWCSIQKKQLVLSFQAEGMLYPAGTSRTYFCSFVLDRNLIA